MKALWQLLHELRGLEEKETPFRGLEFTGFGGLIGRVSGVKGLGVRVSGFRIWVLGFGVQGLGRNLETETLEPKRS